MTKTEICDPARLVFGKAYEFLDGVYGVFAHISAITDISCIDNPSYKQYALYKAGKEVVEHLSALTAAKPE